MKKTLALLLAVMMLLACVPAVAESAVPVFTVGIADKATVVDWNTNRQTLYIEEKLGVDLQFTVLPLDKTERQQKLELMMLSGGEDLPDILIDPGFDMAAMMQYGDMEMIVPLNDYMEDMPYLYKALEERLMVPISKEEYIRNVTCPDGNIYALANCANGLNTLLSGQRMMIYRPWLEKLGLEVPHTTDELLNVLRHFRDDDPNGNGLKDEVPLVSCTNFLTTMLKALINPFIYYQDNYVANVDGTLVFNAEKEEWRTALRYIKQLVDEGLLSPLSFTQDNAQMTAMMTAPTEADVICGAISRNSCSNLAATDPNRETYVLVGTLEGPTGLRQQVYEETTYTPAFVVTKNCEDVAGAMKIGDYISSTEISTITRYGWEGDHYRYLPEEEWGESLMAPFGYVGKIELHNNIWGTVNNEIWAQAGPGTGDGTQVNNELVATQAPGTYNQSIEIWGGIKKELDWANTENRVGNMFFTPEEQEVITEYRSTINDAVSAAIADFVTGVRDLDKDWDAYVKSLHDMGLEPYMETMQSCWDRMAGK